MLSTSIPSDVTVTSDIKPINPQIMAQAVDSETFTDLSIAVIPETKLKDDSFDSNPSHHSDDDIPLEDPLSGDVSNNSSQRPSLGALPDEPDDLKVSESRRGRFTTTAAKRQYLSTKSLLNEQNPETKPSYGFGVGFTYYEEYTKYTKYQFVAAKYKDLKEELMHNQLDGVKVDIDQWNTIYTKAQQRQRQTEVRKKHRARDDPFWNQMVFNLLVILLVTYLPRTADMISNFQTFWQNVENVEMVQSTYLVSHLLLTYYSFTTYLLLTTTYLLPTAGMTSHLLTFPKFFK